MITKIDAETISVSETTEKTYKQDFLEYQLRELEEQKAKIDKEILEVKELLTNFK